MSLLIRWAASAIALYLVTLFVPGVTVSGFTTAILAALVIGLINASLGNILKLLTLPIGCLTLGISSLIINGLMFWLAANLLDGFHVSGFWAAFFGALAMMIVGSAVDFILNSLLTKSSDQ